MEELKNLWKNPKYNALIKLIMWAIFLIIIYIFIILSAEHIKNKNDKESIDNIYTHNLLNLVYNKLSVKYNLVDYYIECIVEKNIFTGTIEYTDGTIYKIKYDGKNISKISSIDNSKEEYLLISFKSEYLIPTYLKELIDKHKPSKIVNNNYYYQIDNIEYQIKQDNTSIYEIVIKDGDLVSKLEYSVIN